MRAGAGRKPKGPKAGVPHRPRPYHDRVHPVPLTLRTVSTLPDLREARVFPAIRRDHLHLLVEARDRVVLARGAKGLAIRCATPTSSTTRTSTGR